MTPLLGQRDLFPDSAPDAEPAPAPIVEGYEHFSLYVADEAGPWPEFVPGYHVDIRQPPRLVGPCSPRAAKTGQLKIEDVAF